MTFTSLDFVVFFAAVCAAHWALPWHAARNALLLAASAVFCGYVHPWFVLPLAATAAADYACALGMRRWPRARRPLLVAAVSVHLAALAVFKYFGFFADSLCAVLAAVGLNLPAPALHVALPAGLSFYTFQALTYVVGVYRGTLAPRRNPLDVALFVGMFPQLMAGPIQRAEALLPQIEARRRWTADLLPAAGSLLAWGFFKKLVVADNLGFYADRVFMLAQPELPLLCAGTLAFAVQIYADFSGYTDIARGVARLLGFDLGVNFNAPYLAVSPSDFWRRWHISLSLWIRDYLYIPLGGSRGRLPRYVGTVLLTMGLSGLWHGASWTFVVWGLYHGLLLLAYRSAGLYGRWAPAGPWRTAAARVVMFVLVCAGWALFRAPSLGWLARAVAGGLRAGVAPDQWAVSVTLAAYVAVYAAPLVVMHACRRAFPAAPWLRALLYGGALAAIAILARDAQPDFIYVKF